MADSPNIYQQLREVQVALKAPKSETGRFGKSRSAELILEAAKPACASHGLTLVTSDEIMFVEGRHYVKATATVFNDAGDSVSATAHAWEGELDRGLDASQVTGKTGSYAKKYALGNLLSIDDTTDADTADQSARPAVATTARATSDQKPEPATKNQIAMALGAAKRASGLDDRADIIDFFTDEFGKKPTELTVADIPKVLHHFRVSGAAS